MNKKISAILILSSLLFYSSGAFSFSWEDLWLNSDQQGIKKFKKNDHAAAADQFKNKEWKGTSHYRAKNYEGAIEDFSLINSSISHYNRGNALAYSNKIKEAIAAYDEALDLEPKNKDAKFNKELLEKMLEDQQQNKNESQQAEQGEKQDGEQQNSGNDSPDDNNDETNEQNQSQEQNQDDQQKQSEQDNKSKKKSPPKSSEKDQSTEQWLRQIPDDPGGLLKQKFLRDYIRRKNPNNT